MARRFAGVAAVTKGLPVVAIPKTRCLAVVRLNVIDHSGGAGDTLLGAVGA
jgi:NAD(P)H-hydrate repair Nnr-like enzyme with NAD(P)H-hydrate dehydratase domain